MNNRTFQGPKHVWRIGQRYKLGFYRWNWWEFSNRMLGSAGRTPISAFLHWHQWKKDYESNPSAFLVSGEEDQ